MYIHAKTFVTVILEQYKKIEIIVRAQNETRSSTDQTKSQSEQSIIVCDEKSLNTKLPSSIHEAIMVACDLLPQNSFPLKDLTKMLDNKNSSPFNALCDFIYCHSLPKKIQETRSTIRNFFHISYLFLCSALLVVVCCIGLLSTENFQELAKSICNVRGSEECNTRDYHWSDFDSYLKYFLSNALNLATIWFCLYFASDILILILVGIMNFLCLLFVDTIFKYVVWNKILRGWLLRDSDDYHWLLAKLLSKGVLILEFIYQCIPNVTCDVECELCCLSFCGCSSGLVGILIILFSLVWHIVCMFIIDFSAKLGNTKDESFDDFFKFKFGFMGSFFVVFFLLIVVYGCCYHKFKLD